MIDKRRMISGLRVLSLLAASAGMTACRVEPVRAPDILLLLADNWGWPHAGAYRDSVVKTPNFDRIAAEGALFTHAFCQVPSCSPARAVLLTGQPMHRLREAANLWGDFPGDLPTYTAMLADKGYLVGFMNKGWGPGLYENRPHTERNPAGRRFESFDQFLREAADSRPFCFWFGSSDPHIPWDGAVDLRAGLDPDQVVVPPYLPDHPVVRSDICDYYGEVEHFDREVGEMLARLEKAGRLENTLVVMVGDNGWQMPRSLASVYDSGTRVCMAIRWPEGFSGARVVDDFVSFEDFAPTFLEAAGLEPHPGMLGRSFLPLLRGVEQAGRDRVFLERERHANVRAGDAAYPCRAVRTRRYLYIWNLRPELWPAGDPQAYWSIGPFGDVDPTPSKELILSRRDEPDMRKFFDLTCGKRPAEELYDLDQDPWQMRNVAGDPANARQKEELRRSVEEWMKATRDPRAEEPLTAMFDHFPYHRESTIPR